MKFRVTVSPIARSDADEIFTWLQSYSPAGAAAWLAAFQAAVDGLEEGAMLHGKASEGRTLGRDVREKFFKTRHGRRYRLLYSIGGNDVRVLRVRGPGQRPVRRRDLK
jgi:plasmid stabilization system protein ParE